jgi:RNA polymerase sigma-70 factor (ECF subfamily)
MRASPEASDEDLWRRARGGDEHAFTLLYRRRHAPVYRFAWQMSGSYAIAEDVTQEVFMTLLGDAGHFEPARGALASYLYGVARNCVLRRLQKERAFVALSGADETCAQTDAAMAAPDDPLLDLTRRETVEAVRQAVLTLPSHYREVVVLCELHELSYAEAAEVLACAVGTVRSRLARARALLCERLRALRPAANEATAEATTEPAKPEAKRCFA